MDDDNELLGVKPTKPDPNAAQVAQLKALQAQLEAAQRQGAAHEGVGTGKPASLSDEVLFGYSFAGIMACLVWSTIAIGLFRYAKITSQFIWAFCAALLLVLTSVTTNDVALWAGGAGLIALTLLVKRFVSF